MELASSRSHGSFEGLQGGSGGTASAKWAASVIPPAMPTSPSMDASTSARSPATRGRWPRGRQHRSAGVLSADVGGQLTLAILAGRCSSTAPMPHVYQLGASVTLSWRQASPPPFGQLKKRTFDLYMKCNNTGGCTVTWTSMPGGTPLFAAGTPPTTSAVIGQVDHWRLTWSPTLGKCVLEVIATGLA